MPTPLMPPPTTMRSNDPKSCIASISFSIRSTAPSGVWPVSKGSAAARPARKRRTSSAAASAANFTVFTEAPAICGVSVTLSSRSNSQSGGTGSMPNVSIAAPRRCRLFKALRQCGIIDQRPARGVDEIGAWLHRRELIGADEAARLLGDARVQRHDVALLRGCAPARPARRRP